MFSDLVGYGIFAGAILWGASMIARLAGRGEWCRHHHRWMFKGHQCKIDSPIPWSELVGKCEDC